MAKEMANIIRPLEGHSPHHIRNIQDFVDQVKSIRLGEGECITSCDVKALVTSFPVYTAITFIRHKLEQGTQLHLRTSMSLQCIITLLEFCLKTPYCLFQGKYYEQLHGAAMRYPISTIMVCSWKSLKPRPYTQPQIHLGCGLGTWMIPFSSKGRTQQPIPATHQLH